jgi:poly-gamma-glutamate synthase PgsB/CapB
MDGTLLLSGASIALAALGGLESWLHRRRLARIPIRVHVNGTRGKSSVTRLIAAGLRAGGIRTCAKTTGTLPRMIFPDGSEYPVYRPSRSNIIEQLRVVQAAAAAQAEALVIECMALYPHLQSVCELQIVRATHGVITNARPDHLDVMGPTARDVARALAGTVPVRGKLFTAEHHHRTVLADAARDRDATLHMIGDDHVEKITTEELNGFHYIEHADNVALALAVCQDLGIDRRTALEGMWNATPDTGVLKVYSVHDHGKDITFVNGFAANDPESTGKNWNLVVERFGGIGKRIALFNCRADRVERSVQLADACRQWKPADQYVLTGTATDVFAKRALANGLHPRQLIRAERMPSAQVVGLVERHTDRCAMVMGMGNIASPGMEIVDYFRSRDRSAPEAAFFRGASEPSAQRSWNGCATTQRSSEDKEAA